WQPRAPDDHLPPANAAGPLLEPAAVLRGGPDAWLRPVPHPATGGGAAPVRDPAWLLAHLPLFRLALFLCCGAYWAAVYQWLRPRAREVNAAVMAVWVQFALGTLLDTQVVRLGGWVYRPMAFTLGGVPLDLHLDWGLTWGSLLVWISSRRPAGAPPP